MGYRLSKQAVEDVLHIYAEGKAQFGTAQAEKYHAKLERTFELIALTPEIVRERMEIDPPIRVYPFESHVILYMIDAKRDVLIIRVRHGREDWESGPTKN